MSGVVRTLDPAGRRLLLIPRRPAPETLAPAAAAEANPKRRGRGAVAGDEQQVAEASGSESRARWRLEGVWWSVVGWGFVVRLCRMHPARAPGTPVGDALDRVVVTCAFHTRAF